MNEQKQTNVNQQNTPEEARETRFVCTGKAIGSPGNDPCWMLRRLDQENRMIGSDLVLFPMKNLKQLWVGQIFEIKMEGRNFWPGSVRHVGSWKDEKQRLEWQAEARTWDTAQRLKKDVAADKNRNLLKERLEPLRRLYERLPTPQAIALLAQILYYMEHG